MSTKLQTNQGTDGGGVLAVIERAALNPDIDIEKMQALLDMQERVLRRNSEMEFNAAMTQAQSEMKRVAADAKNPQTHSRYASYGALDKALRPIYTANGFALSFNTGEGALPDYVRVLCDVSHAAGFSRQYQIDMPADGKGAKGGDVMTKTHAVGAGMSYGMRYLLKMVFNVAVGEDDNDGNQIEPLISESQLADLTALAEEVKADVPKFCSYLKVSKLADIKASAYANAVKALQRKRGKP
jgi:hypothetical protein